MKKIAFFVLALLLVSGVSAAVEDQLQEGLRQQHYQGYPGNMTGFVQRFQGESTSETQAYACLAECNPAGNLTACKRILEWSDEHIFQEDNTFIWNFNQNGTPLHGRDGASDGDIPLTYCAAAGYQLTGDQEFLELYERWKPNVLELTTCDMNGYKYVASSSGKGRIELCNSFNGVYPNYVPTPLLYRLGQFDPDWEIVYASAVKQTEDALKSGTLLPNRCGAYNGSTYDWTQCEVQNIVDPNDGFRFFFWAGWECTERPNQTMCVLLKNAITSVTTNNSYTSEGGYNLQGQPFGSVQFNEYKTAMWIPSFTFAYGEGEKARWQQRVRQKWNGQDFWGTSCWGITGQANCLDMFQDAWINMGFLWTNGYLSIDLEELNVTINETVMNETFNETNETNQTMNVTDYEALYLACLDDLQVNVTLLENQLLSCTIAYQNETLAHNQTVWEVMALEAENQACLENLTWTEDQLQEKEAIIVAMQQVNAELEAERAVFVYNLSVADETIDNLSAQLEVQENLSAQLELELNSSNEQLLSATADLVACMQEEQLCQDENTLLLQDLQALAASYSQLNDSYVTLDALRAELEANLTILQEERDSLETALNVSQEAQQQLREVLTGIRDTIDAALS